MGFLGRVLICTDGYWGTSSKVGVVSHAGGEWARLGMHVLAQVFVKGCKNFKDIQDAARRTCL